MKSTKASIVLCLMVFLLVQGEAARALKRRQELPRVEQYGPVQVSVTWSPEGDGDLVVKTPSGKVINYSNSGPSAYTDYGRLERDVRSGSGPENIYWEDAAPAGTYLVCFRTVAFRPSEENPVRVQATVYSPDGTPDTITKELTEENGSLDCRASANNFIGAFVYRPSQTEAPRRTYAQPPTYEEPGIIDIDDPIIIHEDPIPMPEPIPEPIPIIEDAEYGEPASLADLPHLGPLQFSATWDRLGDSDLMVRTPSGKLIFYNNRGPSEETDYGQLERDVQSGVGPESIYWDDAHTPPAGTYDICLRANDYGESNPVTVYVAIFNGDGVVDTMTKTFSEGAGLVACSPSAPGYIGSYTYGQ